MIGRGREKGQNLDRSETKEIEENRSKSGANELLQHPRSH